MKTRGNGWFAVGLSLATVLALGAGLETQVFAGPAEEEVRETFRANLIGMERGRSTQVDIRISRWTTDEERSDLMNVVVTNDPRALSKAIRNQDSVGWLQLRGQRSYRLRYAREFLGEDGARTIVLATDRPVGMREARGTTQSMDFSITLAILNLDADGKGEGKLSLGNEIVFNEETRKLEITTGGNQPIQMTSIHPVN